MVEDAGGSVVTNYRGAIEVTITTGTGDSKGRLFGGTKILTTNGIVEFKYLSIDKAGAGYTLTASSGNLISAPSAPFTILPGKPAKLAFTGQPSETTAGMPLNPELTVQDNSGNAVSDFNGSVTISAMGYYDDYSNQYQPTVQKYPVPLAGTTTVSLVNGIAHFSDVSIKIKVAQRYTLTAASDSLESATSAYFTIVAGTPVKVEFTLEPSGAKAGTPFEIQPVLAVVDQYGNVVNSARDSITMSITPGSGTAQAVLAGTATLISQDANGGVAQYTDLAIDKAGTGYTLTATISGLPTVQSQAFDVSAP
jgi:hypothetical protein